MANPIVHIKPEEVERVTFNSKEAAKYLGVCYDTLLSAVKKNQYRVSE